MIALYLSKLPGAVVDAAGVFQHLLQYRSVAGKAAPDRYGIGNDISGLAAVHLRHLEAPQLGEYVIHPGKAVDGVDGQVGSGAVTAPTGNGNFKLFYDPISYLLVA